MNTPKPFRRLPWMLFITLAVIVSWILSAIVIYKIGSNWTVRGTMGDMFGAVNALYSGLAFAALIYTIVLQRNEISLNREEIVNNRKELSKSVKTQKDSLETLRQQVKQTHLSAKINAMNTMISYYNSQINDVNNSAEVIDKAKLKRKNVIRTIDDLIDGLDDSNVD